MRTRRLALVLAGSSLVLAAGAIVVWSTVTTSTARLSATTDGSGFFAAGTVDLSRPESTVALLFDADGLYPGHTVSSCVLIEYDGSLDADVRLHASRSGGTSLEDFIDLRLWVRESGSCPEDDTAPEDDAGLGDDTGPGGEPAGDVVYEGRLADLWRAHPDYAGGLVLAGDATAGDRLVLEAEAELVGGDDAQGRTTEFTVIVEARP